MRSPLLALLLASSLPGADLIEANRDPAVSARQDFWTHANGAWLRRFPLAPDRAVYNSFAWQDDLIKKDLLAINADLLAKPDADGDQRRLADFWRSALGFEAGPAELPAGLRGVLAKLDEARTPQALLEASADLYAEGTGTILGVFAGQDKKDETKEEKEARLKAEKKAKKEAAQRKAAREREEAERRRGGGEKKAKGGDKEAIQTLELLKLALEHAAGLHEQASVDRFV